MTDKQRFEAFMNYRPVDRMPLHLVGPWPDTLDRWYNEGLTRSMDINTHFGLMPLDVRNVSPNTGIYPWFQQRVLEEDDAVKVYIDRYGRTVRDFKNHTSMPEWIDFPVKSREDLHHILSHHFDMNEIDLRFGSDWKQKTEQAGKSGAVILIDGGCYYWTLRSLAGVEHASYLFYDAPDLVDELFERINIVCLEALRRAASIAQIDVIGFGEDIGFKTGPLVSPATFRKYILPRYKKVMDLAHSLGVNMTWYDSDGDIRQFIPDYLDVGINVLAPCEVAANMDPVALRKQYGKALRFVGGFDKRLIAAGPSAIDAEFVRIKPLIDEGGFLPAIDHSISADISFANYSHFIKRLKEIIHPLSGKPLGAVKN